MIVLVFDWVLDGDYVQRFIGINMVPTAQKILDIVLPMLPGDPASGIDKCGSSPLEILACLQRAKLSTDIMRWINFKDFCRDPI